MSRFGYGGHGFSLKALLEDPNLQNPPNLQQTGGPDLKKDGKTGNVPIVNHNSAFLGPNLWEKNNSNGSNFDLEYMDLDEFLSENGIPINLEDDEDAHQQAISLLDDVLGSSPTRSPGSSCSVGLPGSPTSPRHNNMQPNTQGQDIQEPHLNGYLPESPIHQQTVSPISLSPVHTPPARESEPSAIEKCLLDDNFCIKLLKNGESKPVSSTNPRSTQKKPSVSEEDVSLVTVPVYMQNSPDIKVANYMGPQSAKVWSETSEDSNIVEEETLVQNSIPGQENFDPANRRFTEDELKPQPIIKKSKKIFVDESAKDDKYWQRRKKNNIAAKRSRDARRVKENQIAMRASFLEQENEEMRLKLEEALCENAELIKRLSKYEKV